MNRRSFFGRILALLPIPFLKREEPQGNKRTFYFIDEPSALPDDKIMLTLNDLPRDPDLWFITPMDASGWKLCNGQSKATLPDDR